MKRSLTLPDLGSYTFKLVRGELTFDDSEPFSRFLEMNELFREDDAPTSAIGATTDATNNTTNTPPQRMLECMLVHSENLESQHVRDRRAMTVYGVVQYRGMLTQRVDGMLGSSWRQRFYTIQDMTLTSFDSDDAQRSALDMWPLGAVIAAQVDSTDRHHPFAFELRKPVAPSGTLTAPPAASAAAGAPTKHPPPVFYADSESSLHAWIGHVNRLHLRRIKLLTVLCAEELESRGLDSVEGVFRVSGSKTHVESLQSEYDAGRLPNLGLIADEHVLTSFLKNNIRNLPEPLITFDLYHPFLKVANEYPMTRTEESAEEGRLAALHEVIARLPQTNQGLLEYLMSFLSRVADFSSVHRMTAANLSIVFAPNLLRPRVENVASIMSDSKAVQECVEMLIRDARTIWPNYTNTRRTSRLAGYNVRHEKESRGAGGALGINPGMLHTVSEDDTALSPSTPHTPHTPSLGRGPPPRPNLSMSFPLLSSLSSPRATPPPLPSAAPTTPEKSAGPKANSSSSSPASSSPPLTSSPSGSPPPPPPRRPSTVVALAVQALQGATPEDLSSVVEHGKTLSSQWSDTVATAQTTLHSSLSSLLVSHTNALLVGGLTSEASSDAASTVHRCLAILSADLMRFQLDLANLGRFIAEQTTAAQTAAANHQGHGAAASLSKPPTRPPPLPVGISSPRAA